MWKFEPTMSAQNWQECRIGIHQEDSPSDKHHMKTHGQQVPSWFSQLSQIIPHSYWESVVLQSVPHKQLQASTPFPKESPPASTPHGLFLLHQPEVEIPSMKFSPDPERSSEKLGINAWASDLGPKWGQGHGKRIQMAGPAAGKCVTFFFHLFLLNTFPLQLIEVLLEDKATESMIKLNLPVGQEALITLKDGQKFVLRVSDVPQSSGNIYFRESNANE